MSSCIERDLDSLLTMTRCGMGERMRDRVSLWPSDKVGEDELMTRQRHGQVKAGCSAAFSRVHECERHRTRCDMKLASHEPDDTTPRQPRLQEAPARLGHEATGDVVRMPPSLAQASCLTEILTCSRGQEDESQKHLKHRCAQLNHNCMIVCREEKR